MTSSPRLSGWVAFQYRDFALYCAGRFVSAIAVQMQNVAIGWLVYDITRDPLALGLVGLVAFVPAIGLALVTGHVADRFDRRAVLLVCYAIAVIAAAGLFACASSGSRQVWPIYALTLVFGATRAFANPASQALVPNLVPAEHFGNAVAWNSSAWQTATIAGPALGGLLYAVAGSAVFGVATGCFALTFVLLALIRHRTAKVAREKTTWTTLVAGIRFIREKPVIFGAISLDLFAVLLGGATALLPIYARDILLVGPWGLGLLRSMPAVGAAATALFLAYRPLTRRTGTRMFQAVTIFGIATIGFGLSTSLPMSLACLFVLGAADMISVFVRQTLVQIDTPDEMRGRVSAVNTVFIGASNELGEFESGIVAALIGTIPAVVVGGVGTLLVAALWARWFPELRDRDRPTTFGFFNRFFVRGAEETLMTQALDYHEFPRPGKLAIAPTKPLTTQHDLALAYSPGVAEACMAIAEDPASASRFTARGNLVAVISNGTAVLGLGNIGPLAAKPVMEGKAVLFKKFADIDVFDIEVSERDPEKLADAVAVLEPTFGAINLEDIKAPECFIVEERLRARMKIPVLHDDQHGTAIVVGATVLNALRCVGKRIEEIRIVSTGGGAAGIACLNLLVSMGARRENIVLVDHQGVVYVGRSEDMTPQKALYARETTARTLADAIPGADLFLGLSAPGILTADMVKQMAPRPMILALANPVPEIMPDIAKAARPDAVIATGRSDFPNQVNNLLCFPFIFRGALDVGATQINEEMKLACVRALADLAMQESSDIVARAYGGEELVFGPEYLIPKPFDPRLLVELAPAVARAAMDSGVATRPIEDLAAYGDRLARFVYRSQMLMKPVFEQAKRNPKRVVYAEGEDERVLRAVQTVLHDGLAEPILIGRPGVIEQRCEHLGLKIRTGADFAVCNPEDYPRYPEYAEFYHRRMERSGVSPAAARAIMRTNPTAIAAVMLTLGEADAMLCGSYGQYAWHLRYVLNVIDKKPVGTVAALSALVLPSGTYFFTDTYVNPDPSAAELVEITLLAAEEVSRLGIKPKVALISHSNFGNADTSSARKMRDAVRMLHERAPDLDVEGEMHADAAINETIRNRIFPHSRLQGSANLLVMPTLDAANSAFNLAKVLGEGLHVGPMLLGITRPAHIVTPSVTARGIVNVTALAVVDAQADRRDQTPTTSLRPSRGELLAEAREVAHGE